MIKVTFYPLYGHGDEDTKPFVRTFSDRDTWVRVQATLQGTYSRIDVEDGGMSDER